MIFVEMSFGKMSSNRPYSTAIQILSYCGNNLGGVTL